MSTFCRDTPSAGARSRWRASMVRTMWARAEATTPVSKIVIAAATGETALGSPGATSTVVAMLLPAL